MEKIVHAIRSKMLRDEKSLRVAGTARGLVLPEGLLCGVLPPARAKNRSFTADGCTTSDFLPTGTIFYDAGLGSR
jgi:hypothetical protein